MLIFAHVFSHFWHEKSIMRFPTAFVVLKALQSEQNECYLLDVGLHGAV